MRSRSAIACSLTAIAICILAVTLTPAASAQSARRPVMPAAAGVSALANLRIKANASQPVVATPVISLAQGSYPGPQTVTVTDATPGAAISYTLDGAVAGYVQYNGPITISKSCTLTVVVTLTGYESNFAYAAYYITSVPDSFVYDVAGSGYNGYGGDGGPAKQALLNSPTGTSEDASGNVYIADSGNNVVRKVDASTGIISTVAGTGIAGYSGDGGAATSAQLDYPDSLAFDSTGNLYISDKNNYVVRKVTISTGAISTYAGSRTATTPGDGGPATSAGIGSPFGVAIDGSDNLYILCRANACGNGLVREVDAKTQIITTVVGGGASSETNGGPATSIELGHPAAIALDASANIYIADGSIWKVTRSTANFGLFAGKTGVQGYSGDGGPATSAELSGPNSLAVDSKGNVYIGDEFNWVFRKVDATTGFISTVAGNAQGCFAFVADGGAALSSNVCFGQGFSFDGAGNLYFADASEGVDELTAIGTPPSTATADPAFSLSAGSYSSPRTLSVSESTPNSAVYLYIATNPPDSYNASSIVIYLGIDGYHGPINVTGSAIVAAQAIAPGHTPSKVVTSAYTYTVPPTALVSTVAGGGTLGLSGAGGPATAVGINYRDGIAMDSSGNLFIADPYNEVIWKVDSSGIITIVAGSGNSGRTGDNGPATAATLSGASAVAVDRNGNIFIADTNNNAVREVLASNGNIVLYAGNEQNSGGCANYCNGEPATSAFIPFPSSVALDNNSNLYIADGNNIVWEVNASTGIINIVAGSFVPSGFGDGGLATSAALSQPQGLAFDGAGNLYIADYGNNRVREVNAETGIINTVVGNGLDGFSGDGQLATDAEVSPNGIAVDGDGNIFIANDYEIRKVDAKTGFISATAGIDYSGSNFGGGPASMTVVCAQSGVLLDAQANLLYSDGCGGIRKITFNAPAPAPTFDPPAGTYAGSKSVAISDTAPNAAIYYTTDGSAPSTSSTQYNSAFDVSKTETINAIAISSGYGQSAVGSAAYFIQTIPTITWATPAPILYGTKLSSTQLDATASVPGTFAYSPAAGTVLPYGSQKLSVTFTPSDTADYTSVTDSVNIAVNKTTPTATLTSSATTADVSEAITLTATVSSPAGTPTGSVTFYNGTTQLGAATLSKGIATYTTSALTTAGKYAMSAQYTGDTNFADAFSNTVAINVSSFGVSTPSGGSTSATISPGGTATYKLTVTPPGDNPVSLSVTGQPVGATSIFNPDSVPAGGPATTVTLSITVPSQSSAAVPDRPGRSSRMPLVFGLLLLPLMGLRRLREGHRALLVLLLGIAGVAGLTTLNGCGGGGSKGGGGGEQQPQTYNLTVAATAGSATQTTALTLIVE